MNTPKQKPCKSRCTKKARHSTLWLHCLIVAAAWLANRTNGTATLPQADLGVKPEGLNDDAVVPSRVSRILEANSVPTAGNMSSISGVSSIAGVPVTVTLQSKTSSGAN